MAGHTMGMSITRRGVSTAYFCSVFNSRKCSAGNVTYLDKDSATKSQLTYVNPSGNAVVRVDNFTVIQPAPLVNRDTVKSLRLDRATLGLRGDLLVVFSSDTFDLIG